jgi:chemosensory pili system protein ChpC
VRSADNNERGDLMSRALHSEVAEHELATLLIPITSGQWVLPNVSVAEIISYTQVQPLALAPDWLLGTIEWRKLRVPLLAVEQLNGVGGATSVAGSRIAVLNGLNGDSRLPFFALVISAPPRLMRILPDEIANAPGPELGPCDLCSVLVSGERAIIPNIDYIEGQLLDIVDSIISSTIEPVGN